MHYSASDALLMRESLLDQSDERQSPRDITPSASFDVRTGNFLLLHTPRSPSTLEEEENGARSTASTSLSELDPLASHNALLLSNAALLVAPYTDADFVAGWPSADAGSTYVLYPTRFWVLFVFCMLALCQSMVWVTFSPITHLTETYYSCSEAQVDLLLNYGCVMYVLAAPFAVHWGTTPRGLRGLMRVAALLEGLAVVLRVLPELFRDTLFPHALYFLHAAQILNAAACPPISVTVTKISSTWFGEGERTAATALVVMMNNFGTALGMVLGPSIVQRPEDIGTLLYVHLGVGLATLFCALVYLPAVPASHPSPAAADMYRRPHPPFFPSLRTAIANRQFLLLALCSGGLMGLFNVWCSILSTILPRDEYDTRAVGWFSFSAVLASISGGLLMALVAQKERFRARLKRFIVTLAFGALLFASWFALSTQSVLSPDEAILPEGAASLGVAITLLGFCIGAGLPLAYELSVEMTYPLAESVSAGIMSIFANLQGIAFLLLAPHMSGATMNAILIVAAAVAAFMLLGVQESYARQMHERQARSLAEGRRMSLSTTFDHLGTFGALLRGGGLGGTGGGGGGGGVGDSGAGGGGISSETRMAQVVDGSFDPTVDTPEVESLYPRSMSSIQSDLRHVKTAQY